MGRTSFRFLRTCENSSGILRYVGLWPPTSAILSVMSDWRSSLLNPINHTSRSATSVVRAFLPILVLTAVLGGSRPVEAAEDSGYVTIRTTSGRDTLVQGLHEFIRLEYRLGNPNDTLAGFDLLLVTYFSGSNTIGPLYDTGSAPNVRFSDFILTTWPVVEWNSFAGHQVTSPDTLATSTADFNYNPPWQGEGLLFEICVSPTDTGTIQIEPAQPVDTWSAFGRASGEGIPSGWTTPIFYVVPCSEGGLVWGDAGYNGSVSSSDIIFLVNYVFKSGEPSVIRELGDIDCSGFTSSSDVILLVNYVFKSADEPCDPCSVLEFR